MKKLVIIPAYNEENSIVDVVNDLQKYAKDFDYIIINDCSTDGTKKVCLENGLNFIDLPVNLGIGGGIQTGYLFALQNNYEYAVQFDGDGQHDAKYINDLLDHMIAQNLDMVIGSRFIEKKGFQSSLSRRFGIKIFEVLLKILYGVKITDATSGFRMVNRKVIQEFCNYYPQDYPEPETIAIALRKCYRVGEKAVIMKERQHGISSINLARSFYYMIKVPLAILIDKTKGE